ncbi:MAG: glycerophosphoryl diester phosphodiesterase membrane domain-containing protein [Acidobacteria bacterium]|nr:glycerophosphoryl diester phosphodiesterase membrane domain-containing protein [Acidobacteriota bacterium]
MSEETPAPPYQRMSFGQVLERIFFLFRDGRRTFIGISIVPPAAFFVVLGIALGSVMIPFSVRLPRTVSETHNSQMGLLFFASMSLVMLTWSTFFAPSLAAGCYAAVHADLGRHVTFKESYAFALKRYGNYFVLFLMMVFFAMAPVLVFELLASIPAISLRHHSGDVGPAFLALIPIGMAGFLVVYVLSIYLMLRFSLAFPACVTESLAPMAAVRRSSLLTRGAKGRIFLVLLVVYAACYAGYLVGIVLAAIWIAFLSVVSLSMRGHVPTSLALPVGILTLIGVVCMMAFFMACGGAGFNTALAVLYNDQRRVIDEIPANPGATGAQG